MEPVELNGSGIGYHSELSLTVANEGAHWEHLKNTPIWGVSRPPLKGCDVA
jgi:hypothetical protein